MAGVEVECTRLVNKIHVPSESGGDPGDAARTRLEDRELLRLFEAVQSLPAGDRGVVIALIDAFVKKRQLEAILGSRAWRDAPFTESVRNAAKGRTHRAFGP